MDSIELGQYINYEKTSIYGLVQKRKIPYIKASEKLHFHKKDIDKWLNESKKMSRHKANEYVARHSNMCHNRWMTVLLKYVIPRNYLQSVTYL